MTVKREHITRILRIITRNITGITGTIISITTGNITGISRIKIRSITVINYYYYSSNPYI